MKKKCELWSTNDIVYAANVYPPKMNTARAVCRLMQLHSQVAFLGAKFQPRNCLSSRTCGPRRPKIGLCPIFLVIFFIFVILLHFYFIIKVTKSVYITMLQKITWRTYALSWAHSSFTEVFNLG